MSIDREKAQNSLALWNDFLAKGDAPEYTMDCFQLQGYLCALARGPGQAKESDWLPLIFGGETPTQLRRCDDLIAAVRTLYLIQIQEQAQSVCHLPFESHFSPIRAERVTSEQWARGFMQGYIFWQNIWSEISDQTQTNDNLAAILHLGVLDEIDDILATVSAIADAEYALQIGKTVEELYKLNEGLAQIVVNYGRVSQDIKNTRLTVSGSLQ